MSKPQQLVAFFIVDNKDISSTYKTMNVKGYEIKTDNFEEQTSPQGKCFRHSATERTDEGWLYKFKYLDGSGFFSILTDKQNNFKTIIK